MFQAVWRGFKVKLDELKDNMRRHRHLIESQASIVQFQESLKLRKFAEGKFEDIQKEFVQARWPAVRQWLTAYNSKKQQDFCAKKRAECPDSGQWLLTHDRFMNWLDPIYCTTPLLWLNGNPGAGKTILASKVVEAVECLGNQYRLAYFYCKENDEKRNSFVAVARGILSQLLMDNPDLVLQLYDKGNLQSGEAILLDQTMAKSLLDVALDSAKTTYLVIDGIDECDRDERKEICRWFCERINQIPKEEFGNIRCLFVSQDDGAARHDLGMVPSIGISIADTREDMRRFVATWHAKMVSRFGQFDYPLTDMVISSARGELYGE